MSFVIHSSDAGMDDFVSTALLHAAAKKGMLQLKAVIITDADCEAEPAYHIYQKMRFILNMDTKIGLSKSRVKNDFPEVWRKSMLQLNKLPALRGLICLPKEPVDGDFLLARTLSESESVKLVATGPLTTLSDLFKQKPSLMEKVREIHWMGGAVKVPGNLEGSPGLPNSKTNSNAEWNVFCDPESAHWVFTNMKCPIHLYPLDISDSTIPAEFIAYLDSETQNRLTQFVSQAYKTEENNLDYRMWDVVAAMGVIAPEIFESPTLRFLEVVTSGKEEGSLKETMEGREVLVYSHFKNNDPEVFYKAVADLCNDS